MRQTHHHAIRAVLGGSAVLLTPSTSLPPHAARRAPRLVAWFSSRARRAACEAGHAEERFLLTPLSSISRGIGRQRRASRSRFLVSASLLLWRLALRLTPSACRAALASPNDRVTIASQHDVKAARSGPSWLLCHHHSREVRISFTRIPSLGSRAPPAPKALPALRGCARPCRALR